MTVRAILKQKGRDVVAVPPTLSVEQLSHLLHERRIGAALVQDAAGGVLGIVSERDVVSAIATSGARALAISVDQVMTRAPRTIPIGATVEEAMAMMTAGRFRHLPVIEGGALAGLVSIGDVVKARLDEQEHEVDSLKAYVAGAA